MFKQAIRQFVADNRAESGAGAAVEVIVGLLVGGLMAAYLLPLAINEIVSVSTSSWGTGAAELWGLLPVVIVLGVFLFFVGLALDRSEGL